MRKFLCGALAAVAWPAAAQVNQELAAKYFQETAAICGREGGKLWGVSLCGPMVFADPATKTTATNLPPPAAKLPPMVGFANTAIVWSGTRWSTYVWQYLPKNDERARARLLIHELFHRIQPELGFFFNDGDNSHLDTLEGRYWIQLEWRALAKALASSGDARKAALRDALAFRSQRRKMFPRSGLAEQSLEINEGIAQYTATVVVADSHAQAEKDVIDQLNDVLKNETFVRTFPYPSGAAYGVLLDQYSPGWPKRLRNADDLPALLKNAAQLDPSPDVESAAKLYGAADLRAAEEKRDANQKARVAELRKKFVDGPVLILPRIGGSMSFTTNGMTPIPGEGIVYPGVRTDPPWGRLEAGMALVADNSIRIPAPAAVEGSELKGEGWSLTIAKGWVVKPGKRAGDYELVQPK